MHNDYARAVPALLSCQPMSAAQVPDGDWFCFFNPDPKRRSCSVPEQALEDDKDGSGHLAVLNAPGFAPAGDAAKAADLHSENVAFYQRLLGQRTCRNAVRRAPTAAVWWLATEAGVPVRECCAPSCTHVACALQIRSCAWPASYINDTSHMQNHH